jgi:hypothetical protein
MKKSELKKLAEVGDKFKYINNKQNWNLTFGRVYEVAESYFSQIGQDYKIVIKDDLGGDHSVYTLSLSDNFEKI